MAGIRLGRYEIEEYGLPRVCARCGDEAVARPYKTFSWHPGWVLVLILAGLLIYVIVAIILTKRMTVRLPFCARHRNYWRNRAIFVYGGLLALVLLGVVSFAFFAAQEPRGADNTFGLVCVGTGGLFIVWLFAVAIVQVISIRPAEITDKSITLTGLSRDFVDAVREDRRGGKLEDEDDYGRPRRKRPRDVDEERRVQRRRALDEEDDHTRSKRRADPDDEGFYDPQAKPHDRAEDEDDQ
jgi:hypothetical protein